MTLPTRIQHACNEMRKHLGQFDWSTMTNGRQQILNVFLNLAIERGYKSVTMRGLAHELEIKASSIYFHFPGGRDEIIGETLRWHYYNWGTEILQIVDGSATAGEFLDNLVRAHVKRQIELPESDLWDILVATDRVYALLRPDFHSEIQRWLDICTQMYEAAAHEMGYKVGTDLARAVMKLLDTVSSWSDIKGSRGDLEACVVRAITISRAILSCEAENNPSSRFR